MRLLVAAVLGLCAAVPGSPGVVPRLAYAQALPAPGPEAAAQWWALRAGHESLARARLAAEGLIDANGVPTVNRDALRVRLGEAERRVQTANDEPARERAQAEIRVLRGLVAELSRPDPNATAFGLCNELPIAGRPSACVR